MVKCAKIAFRQTLPRAVHFLIIAALAIGYVSMPPGVWFRVHDMYVANVPWGQSPKMRVVREIVRPFRGEWDVAVLRRSERTSRYVRHCGASGAGFYEPGTDLPDDLDLDWWTDGPECLLMPGSYKVKTLWTLHPEWFPMKQVAVESNVFTVYPGVGR